MLPAGSVESISMQFWLHQRSNWKYLSSEFIWLMPECWPLGVLAGVSFSEWFMIEDIAGAEVEPVGGSPLGENS